MKAKVKEQVTLTLTLSEARTVQIFLRKAPKKPDTKRANQIKRRMWNHLEHGVGMIYLLRNGYGGQVRTWDGSYDS